MAVPTSVAELLTRARSALGHKIEYHNGSGGRNPDADLPVQDKKCDCSGFVAWCLGFDRFIKNDFYAKINGEKDAPGRGWFETSAVYEDARKPGGIVRQIEKAVVGAIVVYPDHAGHEGHIGIVTEVHNGRHTRVIHCSASAWNNDHDAVQENAGTAFTNNAAAIYAWYQGLPNS